MARGLVCVKCMKFFRVKKQGVAIEEGMPLNDQLEWGSYKLWMADLHECPGCGAQIMAGFGWHPVAEHFQEGYQQTKDNLQPIGRVDDCGGAKP